MSVLWAVLLKKNKMSRIISLTGGGRDVCEREREREVSGIHYV